MGWQKKDARSGKSLELGLVAMGVTGAKLLHELQTTLCTVAMTVVEI